MDTEVREIGELHLLYEVPLVEVYLKPAVDPRYAATLAPPWSPVPWHVLALMEQAVARRGSARSPSARPGAAACRGWISCGTPAPGPRWRRSSPTLERRAWVPEALRGLVAPDEARERWRALRQFQRKTGHFLVTAGPYQVGRVTAESATLPVFRDFTYPLGVGSFDQFALPSARLRPGRRAQGRPARDPGRRGNRREGRAVV